MLTTETIFGKNLFCVSYVAIDMFLVSMVVSITEPARLCVYEADLVSGFIT